MKTFKSFLPPALAGALCPPSIYSLTREGSYPTAILIVVVIGALGGAIAIMMSKVKGRPRLLHLASAFVIGALISEFIFFAYYYITYGYHDPELVLGVIGGVMEFGGIAVVGGMSTSVATLVQNRIATNSGELPPAPANS